jgi:hypothetical protein
MERGHGNTEAGSGFHSVGNRVGNIVKLEIQEDAAAALLHGLDHRRAFCGEKFQADLAEGRGIAQGVKESEGSVGIGNIEGDDDFVLGSGR